jgi:hypothetical protein
MTTRTDGQLIEWTAKDQRGSARASEDQRGPARISEDQLGHQLVPRAFFGFLYLLCGGAFDQALRNNEKADNKGTEDCCHLLVIVVCLWISRVDEMA